MNKKEKLAFAVIAALAMTSGGFAFGQSVNNVSSDQVIYACVTGVNGNITKVSNTPKTCPKGTTPISWNMVGPKGDQGIPGVTGLKGDKGESGLAGANGEAGETSVGSYLISPDGASYRIFTAQNANSTFQAVLMNGKVWQLNGTSLYALSNPQIGSYALFTASDCSSTGYFTSAEPMIQYANGAYSNPLDNENNAYSFVETSNTALSDFRSIGYFDNSGPYPEFTCQLFDFSALKQAVSSWIAEIKGVMANPYYASETSYLRLDYANCLMSEVTASGKGRPHQLSNCLNSSGSNLISILENFSPNLVNLFRWSQPYIAESSSSEISSRLAESYFYSAPIGYKAMKIGPTPKIDFVHGWSLEVR
jgi:hypothetical protein